MAVFQQLEQVQKLEVYRMELEQEFMMSDLTQLVRKYCMGWS